jgi:hypothetical protein
LHAWAILALLVKTLRKRWPKVKIILRADSGFCRWKMLRWCERVRVNYIVGLAKNQRLQTLSEKLQKRAERKYQRSASKVRLFASLKYKAKSWDKKRRVIAKAEHGERGGNPRYVIPTFRVAPKLSMMSFTALEARWKIESRNSSWAFSVIGPAVMLVG